MENIKTELIIIGAGPAGLTASIYASRYGIQNVVIGALSGGQVAESHLIDNYPGVENISGADLAKKMFQHAEKYGVEIIPTEATSIKKGSKGFEIETTNGKNITSQAIIFATGTQRKKLNAKGEEKFYGKGVSYCATCDGFFQKNKEVAVIGGSDSAAGAAVYLSGIAKKVYLIYRKKELRCEQYWKKLLKRAKNVEVLTDTTVSEIGGNGQVEGIKTNQLGGAERAIGVTGVFIEVGAEPKTALAKKIGVETDEAGYIIIKENGSTSIEGVWAAGDATSGSDKLKQIITAASEGAIAARSAAKYIEEKRK